MRAVLVPLALLCLANADPDPDSMAPAIRAMLRAAMESGNEAEVLTVAKYAASADPANAEVISEIATQWRDGRRAAAERHLREAAFLDLMTGRVELGGFSSTGNTNNIGVTGSAEIRREGAVWRHKVRLLAEYQETARIATREHYLAAYEPNLKIDDRLYAYGAAQFEADRFLGYNQRYSGSLGAGYSAIRKKAMTLDLELGPAYRNTKFTDQTIERNLAARGSLDFDWRLTPGVTFSQDASAYVQSANSTLSGKSALSAKLFGPLSAQLSYTVSYESRPVEGRVNTDTTSRASLVYAF